MSLSNPKISFIPYNQKLTSRAKENRKNPTSAEKKMWYEILNGNRVGYRFLRQKPIDNFILDFYRPKLLFSVEIDGDTHAQQIKYDQVRTNTLNKLGIRIIRYANREVLNNLEGVYLDLMHRLEVRAGELKPPRPPLSGGQGQEIPLSWGRDKENPKG